MKWTVAKALGIGLLILPNIAKAQPTVEPSLILSTQCGRFHVVLGRLQLDGSFYKKVRLHQTNHDDHKDHDDHSTEEYVCVTATDGAPALHYQRNWDGDQVTIDTLALDAIRITSTRKLGPDLVESLLLEQPSHGDITITHSVGNQRRDFSSASLWHLMMEEPILFEQAVLPLLALIIDDAHWKRSAEAIEQRLQHHAASQPRVTRTYIEQCVQQLSADKRHQRLQARNRLMDAGVGALPILASLDSTNFDNEQKMRIAEVRRHLCGGRRDTVERVAAWLATDHHYWSLASRNWPSHHRIAANQYMIAVCGNPLTASSDRIARNAANLQR